MIGIQVGIGSGETRDPIGDALHLIGREDREKRTIHFQGTVQPRSIDISQEDVRQMVQRSREEVRLGNERDVPGKRYPALFTAFSTPKIVTFIV